MIVLIYAYYNFHLDRAVFDIRQQTMPAGSFDRIARLFANPAEQAVLLVGFRSMLLSTTSTIVMKTVLLLISIYKWRKIITTVVQSTHAKRQNVIMPKKRQQSRRHLCLGFTLFMLFGIGVVMHTISAIAITSKNCAPYANCVVASNQWYVKSGACPCLVYSNRNDKPSTWDQWMNPPNATEELSILAETGDLTTIYITNHALPTLPDSLQHCTHLTQLYVQYLDELDRLDVLFDSIFTVGRSSIPRSRSFRIGQRSWSISSTCACHRCCCFVESRFDSSLGVVT